MTSATGSLIRDTVLYDCIRALDGFPNFERVVAALPPDFDLDATEYEAALKILNRAPHDAQLIDSAPAETKLSNVSEGTIAPERMGDAPIEPVEGQAGASVEVELTLQQANDAVLSTQNAVGEARLAYRRAQENSKAARSALANSVTIWQTGLPVYTSEMNVRAHLKAAQAARRERIAGLGPAAGQSPAGKSYIDRAAKYGRDNTPEGAARSRMRNGASRGAFSRSEVAARNFQNHDPRRGPVVKLPSER